ncbi:MAG: bacterioferritin [Gammaproteobacteria bacterium]|uniref:ferritin-like domain-containing protein n=1 Tax=Pseudomaricurvus alcaniphilus TaxID=1166482 RepID=UPI001409EFE5|nr:ferritin-like domain-containing protein [Pseudomaricurvus alcaniphilus]MBR9910570.1 bacterioferritin [Gammaproteobacteria bacterium]NHN39631.1 bacterioferritin [Pseudomaricurvus alcaniphilus]
MRTELPNQKQIIEKLNQILEHELAGVVRYTHYSFMIFGFSRIPVVSWFRDAANETLLHATEAGEMITLLGGHPSLAIGNLLETHQHDMAEILKESMDFEIKGVEYYRQLLTLAETAESITLEEYARQKIAEEAVHIGDIDKMLRRPGDIKQAIKAEAP